MRRIKQPYLRSIAFTEIMHALSDPTRVEIIRKLAERGDQELTCSALLGDRPKSSMSHHFKILRSAGLIETTVVGKEHINRLREKDLNSRFPGLMKSLLHVIKKSV
jgi:DNA-binding transcriptional ArsR family regulator